MYKAARGGARPLHYSHLRAHFNDFGVFSFCVVAQTKPTRRTGHKQAVECDEVRLTRKIYIRVRYQALVRQIGHAEWGPLDRWLLSAPPRAVIIRISHGTFNKHGEHIRGGKIILLAAVQSVSRLLVEMVILLRAASINEK